MIEKNYDPKGFEKKWYDFWLENDYFKASPESDKPPYCIVIPPPNVTGSLHLGHALDLTLQDILIRWKRMSGFNTLWLPGTDHAGIATQNVVEKELKKQGMDRHKLGREKFIKKVWEWKDQYGGRIIHQLKSLGASCDWSRERFTLDEGLSKAVKEVFIRLYKEDLIYRGDYIINWCPRCQTALSDLEVEHEEKKGKLYYIQYDFVEGDGNIVVATTRPETLLGDTAVAVNPKDKRFKNLVGKILKLPLLGREIPIIKDDFVDVSFGTGAVKVTPAHDPNDFEIAGRHGLPYIKIMTENGTMSEEAGHYNGMDRFECRKKVISDLESSGILVEVKEHVIGLGHCYRCKTIVEPFLSKQWFVRTRPLADEAVKAVKNNDVKIIPSGWSNSYFDWMKNIKDWCISRQIWWGHRIPVWYCKTMQSAECKEKGGIIVSAEEPRTCPYCGSGASELIQDEDVLDTWFSSALWPFSTLGWPDKTGDLKTFYPTNVLITGFDILFFWVARMMMMGLKFMKNEPFKHIYIHALIRDSGGQKMSKSKGNVIDPLEMTGIYGTDSFRFALTAFAAQGRDIRFSEQRVEGYKHFINKIWNAVRFILVNVDKEDDITPPHEINHLSLSDRWILDRLHHVAADVNKFLDEYRFNDSANLLYQFMWHEFCDWYLEMSKPALYGDNADTKKAALCTIIHVLETSIALLHPFIPFVTEELWQHLPVKNKGKSLCIRKYPDEFAGIRDKDAEAKMKIVMDAVAGIRSIRGELDLSPSLELKAIIKTSDENKKILNENIAYISKLAKTSTIETGSSADRPEETAVDVRPTMEIFVPLRGLFDIDVEIQRLLKEVKKIEKSLSFVEKKLSNEDFISKAPKAVVDENKANHLEYKNKITAIMVNINKFKKLGQQDA